MARKRKYYDERNLTALRALPLLVQTTKALGRASLDLVKADGRLADLRSAVEACQQALENHVRFAVRRSKVR